MMTVCKHRNLVLLPAKQKRLRCRHCHLTITPEELDGGYCPECYEVSGIRRDDFEEIEDKTQGAVQSRCEDCGVLVTS